MVERRMRAAIISVGSIWYTAWVDAGQPDLNSLLHIKPSPELLEELRAIDEMYAQGKKKGRICE